jgi:hypothetical protein
MTQRMQLHSVGTFPVCPDCHDEYRHIRDDRAHGGGHFLSCCCGDSPKLPTFEALRDAMRGWCVARGVAVPDSIEVRTLDDDTPRLVQGVRP